MTIETRKYHLIKAILQLENDFVINKLEEIISNLDDQDQVILKLARPLKDKLNLAEAVQEQQYQPPTKEELNKLIKEANIEEPLEELLRMI